MHIRLYCRRISLWIILALQLLLIGSYFLLPADNTTNGSTKKTTEKKKEKDDKVSFLKVLDHRHLPNFTYHTIYDKFKLRVVNTTELYDDFNSSLCYKLGTDLKLMHRSKDRNWRCNCLPDWHGSDCGQPEVIWRALLAYRKSLSLKGPRKNRRRIIYVSQVVDVDLTITEIKVSELNEYVDLFVFYENETDSNFQNRLRNGFLRDYHARILYMKATGLRDAWGRTEKVVTNLEYDDVVLFGESDDIPNGLALQFLKLYDGWPQPIYFRFRWSVYGFFWLHPTKTVLRGGAATVLYLGERVDVVKKYANRGLIVGDLNHFGGWLCEFCYEPVQIIEHLKSTNRFANITSKKIDNAYIEDLIENGIYLDSKTELTRMRRYREKYYAPNFVTNNSWKFDWLLINLYSKLDYY